MWDSDTLATEAKGLPGVVEALTGRIDINPALYYEMRLKRVTAHVPMTLSEYDDAAVSCEKLDRTNEAIAWMSKKRGLLDQSPNKDHEYRYHANLGTFFAHRWLKQREKDPTWLDRAIQEVQTAININPEAHFGRELVQLGILRLFRDDLNNPKPDDYRGRQEWVSMVEGLGKDKAGEGLIGLIALRSAFESIDVVVLLGSVDDNSASLHGLAKKRVEQLTASGRKPIMSPDYLKSLDTVGGMLRDDQWIQKAWLELSREGEKYRQNRIDFMLRKLKLGKHPDTDSDFWKGYVETPRTDFSRYEPSRSAKQSAPNTVGVFLVASFTLLGLGLLIIRRLKATTTV